MSKICKVCGWENEDGDKICAMCNAELDDAIVAEKNTGVSSPSSDRSNEKENVTVAQIKTVKQTEGTKQQVTSSAKRYVVNCENSRTKTVVDSPNITSYYCEGCKEEHQIDGFFWIVQEEEEPSVANEQTENISVNKLESIGNGDRLILEDVDTHEKIEISSAGGTLGRYGTYGSAYLQGDPRGRMVSGEHCRFKYEYGRWSIEHLSRTNDTVYNGRKLEHGYEEGLRDGKIITLANVISFMVRIV